MKLFITDTMVKDITPPPREGRFLKLRKIAYMIGHSDGFTALVTLTIFISITSMFGQQSMADVEVDLTGVARGILIAIDQFALIVFLVEFIFNILGLGVREYFTQRWFEFFVFITMWLALVQRYLARHTFETEEINDLVLWFQWIRVFDFLRGLRAAGLAKRVHVFRKIFFLVKVAMPQVVQKRLSGPDFYSTFHSSGLLLVCFWGN